MLDHDEVRGEERPTGGEPVGARLCTRAHLSASGQRAPGLSPPTAGPENHGMRKNPALMPAPMRPAGGAAAGGEGRVKRAPGMQSTLRCTKRRRALAACNTARRDLMPRHAAMAGLFCQRSSSAWRSDAWMGRVASARVVVGSLRRGSPRDVRVARGFDARDVWRAQGERRNGWGSRQAPRASASGKTGSSR